MWLCSVVLAFFSPKEPCHSTLKNLINGLLPIVGGLACLPSPRHCLELVVNHRITKYPELEGTHKDH